MVLDGQIDNHYRESGVEQQRRLGPGAICRVELGDEHVATQLASSVSSWWSE